MDVDRRVIRSDAPTTTKVETGVDFANVWAVTGAIAAGKSTVLQALHRRGLAVLDSDDIVASIYQDEHWKASIATTLGLPIERWARDRATLREHLMRHPDRWDALERLLHPEVWRRIVGWRVALPDHQSCAVAVPLLFEVGWAQRFAHVVVVTAPHAHRRARALRRPGMTPDWLDAIERRQWDDAQRLAAGAPLGVVTVHNPDGDTRHTIEQAIDKSLAEHARRALTDRANQGRP